MFIRFIRISVVAAFAALLAQPLVAGSTTTMPSADNGECHEGDCAQGMLYTDILREKAGGGSVISWINSGSIGGKGWAAGTTITADFLKTNGFFKWSNTFCTMKLRGETLIRIFHESVMSKELHPGEGAQSSRFLLQVSGAQITYSTTLPASQRLLEVRVNNGFGGWQAIDRTALYTVAASNYDFQTRKPYNAFTNPTRLAGETAIECTSDDIRTIIANYISTNTPVTIPTVKDRHIAQIGGTPMVVEQSTTICKGMTPPHIYDTDLASCVKCPTGASTIDGIECKTPGGGPASVCASDYCTENALVKEDSKACDEGDCVHGNFFTDAIRHNAGGGKVIAIQNEKSLSNGEWNAKTDLSEDDMKKGILWYGNKLCTMNLRGVTILRIMQASVASADLPGADGGQDHDPLQISGLRITYSSTLPPAKRLLSVTVDEGAGTFVEIDRTAVYKVVSTDYDVNTKKPYTTFLKDPKLPGESEPECGGVSAQTVMLQYIKYMKPYSIPQVTGERINSQPGGTAIEVNQNAAICKVLSPPHYYNSLIESCEKCAPTATSDGTSCSGGTAISTGMSTVNAMPSAEGNKCLIGDCGQGMLFTDALRSESGSDIAYVNGKSVGGPGWEAGTVTEDDILKLFKYSNKLCTMKMRGVTLLKLAEESVATVDLPGAAGGVSNRHLIQWSGLRVTYSTTLEPHRRLVEVEVINSGAWVNIDRTALYTVAATDYEFKSKKPYNALTSEPIMDGETKYTCGEENVQQAVHNYLKVTPARTIPTAAGTRNVAVDGGERLSVTHTVAKCIAMEGENYLNTEFMTCTKCPAGQISLSGVSCGAPGTSTSGKNLVVAAERLIAATTHAPLLSGGLHGCRQSEGGAVDLSNTKCTGGLVEAVMNFHTKVAPATPSATHPMPLFIPTADYADELLSMHADRWGAQCAMFTRFKASAFQVTRVDLTNDQELTTLPWTCTAKLVLGNAQFLPKKFWFNDAQSIFVDKDSGLGFTVIINQTASRAQDVVEKAIDATTAAEQHADAKAFIIFSQGADITKIAEELNANKVFATAVIDTTKNIDSTLVGDIWVGGMETIGWAGKRLSDATLVGPFVPHSVKPGMPAMMNKAHSLKLFYHNPPSAADRQSNTQWKADQEFMQGIIDKALTHNPVVGKSLNPMDGVGTGAVTSCQKGDCMQGMLVADVLQNAAGGPSSIALVGSSSLGGAGWPVGDVKVSDVYDVHRFPNLICTQKLRGQTLLTIFGEMVKSHFLPGMATGAKEIDTWQFAGARVTFSTILTASARLSKVEVIDVVTGNWVPIDATNLYDVIGSDYDLLSNKYYKKWTKVPGLESETVPNCGNKVLQDEVVAYVGTKSPMLMPTDARLIASDGTKHITINVTAHTCLMMTPPQYLDGQLGVCQPCPVGYESHGTYCKNPHGNHHTGGDSGHSEGNGGSHKAGNAGGAAQGSAIEPKHTGVIVGVVIGVLALIAVLAAAAFFVHRSKSNEAASPQLEAQMERLTELQEVMVDAEKPKLSEASHRTPTVADKTPPVTAAVPAAETDEDI